MNPGVDWEKEQELGRACDKAMRLLAYAQRSKRGLYDKLRQAGFTQEISEAAVGRMEEYGYVNDEKFARDYAVAAFESKGHGRYRVIRDLRGKGVDGETASNAVEAYFERLAEEQSGEDNEDGDDPELSSAASLLEKRLRRQGLDPGDMDAGDVRRAVGFLSRRGFSFGIIREALSLLGAGEEMDEGDGEDY